MGYFINRSSCIYLYGQNDLSEKSYFKLLKDNYNVVGIIDRAYNGIETLNGFTVFGLECIRNQFVKLVENNKNRFVYVCIICLNSGIQHEIAADFAYEIGFDYVLYLPMKMQLSIVEQQIYRRSYREFINGRFECVCIPENGNNGKIDSKYMIINDGADRVSFWAPKSLLRTGTREMLERDVKERGLNYGDRLIKYADNELDDFFPYIGLFESLGGNERLNADEYLMIQRNNYDDRVKLYKDRIILFDIFEERFKYDMSFFLDSPACVSWNDNGWLTINDGLHRIFYLNYKGFDSFPVETSREEFEKCCKSDLN